jgi:hypoxanthine phosphoribosyltransferase
VECDRNKLKGILNISLNALKLIEKRNNLEYRLNKVGYTLIDKYKKKNKYIYVIKKSNKELKQKISNMYNTNRADKFINYFNIRTIEQPKTIKEIA